jgi:polyribonucleotide nucleotidyltransferase
MVHDVEMDLAGRRLRIETGSVARQADGAVLVRYGDTVVLVTAVSPEEQPEDKGFLPLLVEYREQAYAAGKIPGGFFKREGRPREKEIVSSRLIDRTIRPLFPEGYHHEIQIVAMVLSADQENDSDILAVTGASAALSISDIPFLGPVSCVRIGRLGDEFVVNPTFAQLDESSLNLVVAGTAQSLIMVEAGAREVPDSVVLDGFRLAHERIKEVCLLQEKLVTLCGKPKRTFVPPEVDLELVRAIREATLAGITDSDHHPTKEQRQAALTAIVHDAQKMVTERFPGSEAKVEGIVEQIHKEHMIRTILSEGRRVDGRGTPDIRPLDCRVSVLPRTHGSAIFTRGETQSLAVTTLGTVSDEQKIDDLEGESFKSYMLHYNFPPFSVGELRPIRGPGRREIGHGALAERAIAAVIPKEDAFPYTIRIVSDILESNGSSSMASVCSGSLSLMDAGVPIKAPVSGVAMGLAREGEKYLILTDIAGVEDHLGEMDFKVAGTHAGITALQLDIKSTGIPLEILGEALEQAGQAREKILRAMEEVIPRPRAELSAYAPRILTLVIPKDKIGAVIGPGGKVIRKIVEETGAKIDIEDDGRVIIASVGSEGGEKALAMVKALVEEVEVGKIYMGRVTRTMNFGAFVEVLPNQEGLIHISQLAPHRVEKVTDVLKEGDEVLVKVIEIDEQGRINLSRKAALAPSKDEETSRSQRPRRR